MRVEMVTEKLRVEKEKLELEKQKLALKIQLLEQHQKKSIRMYRKLLFEDIFCQKYD